MNIILLKGRENDKGIFVNTIKSVSTDANLEDNKLVSDKKEEHGIGSSSLEHIPEEDNGFSAAVIQMMNFLLKLYYDIVL